MMAREAADTEAANREVVARLWRLIEERRWDEAGDLLADDVVCDYPHSGERIRGRQNYLDVNRHHPVANWHIDVRRLVAEGDVVVAEVRVPHDQGVSHVASFVQLEDGKIVKQVDYWIDLGQQDSEPYRARWVEPLEAQE